MTRVDVEVSVVPAASVGFLVVEGDAMSVVGEDVAEAVQPEIDRQLSGVPTENLD